MANSPLAAMTGVGAIKTRTESGSVEHSSSKASVNVEDREYTHGQTSFETSGSGGEKRFRLPLLTEEDNSATIGGGVRTRGEANAAHIETPGFVDKSQGVVRSINMPTKLAGKSMVKVDPRKFSYNALRASSRPVVVAVTRDDRLSVGLAKAKLNMIHENLGVHADGQDPDDFLLGSFDNALWFCHTLNGSSVLNPGRSTFSVPGVTQVFQYSTVLNILGNDARRFFRAYADDIAEVNKAILAKYDPNSPIDLENWSWLMEVASNRGLARYPYLAHDSADACMHLSHAERMAVANSKVSVLSRVVNVADSFNTNSRVQTLDKPKEEPAAKVEQ